MLKAHWEEIYGNRHPDDVSWFQKHPSFSLALFERSEIAKDEPIIDVGAGASHLVDHLLLEGYSDITLLDLSPQALDRTRQRLGEKARSLRFIEGDVLTAQIDPVFALWHDRAVFHFLTEPEQRLAYKRRLKAHVKDEGFFIVATFDENGPLQCSGLPVVRYSADELEEEFAQDFVMLSYFRDDHTTPAGRTQSFGFALFQKR